MSSSPPRSLFESLRNAASSSTGAAPTADADGSSTLASSFRGFGLGVGAPERRVGVLSSVSGHTGGGGEEDSGGPAAPASLTQPAAFSASSVKRHSTAGLDGSFVAVPPSDFRGSLSPFRTNVSIPPRPIANQLFSLETTTATALPSDLVRDLPSIKSEPTAKVTFRSEHSVVSEVPFQSVSVGKQVTSGPNSVALTLVDLENPTICGAVIGTSGKFCLWDKAKCPIKSHKRAEFGWTNVSAQGTRLALFIQVPGGIHPSTAAFRQPVLRADGMSSLRIKELLLVRKPVALWGGFFSFLESEAMDTEEDLRSDITAGRLDTDAYTPSDSPVTANKEDHDELMEATSDFVPKLEHKFAEATTAAKRAKATEGTTILTPPLLMLKDMGADNSDAEFRAAASFNIEELHNSHFSLRQEVHKYAAIIQAQLTCMASLADKINVLSGVVGVPDQHAEALSLWQTTTIVRDLVRELTTQLGSTVHRVAELSSQTNTASLDRAETHDIRRHLEVIESKVLSVQGEVQHQRSLILEADSRARELEIALERGIEDAIVKTTKRELYVHLHVMEPLLMRTQDFLDRVLPTLVSNASQARVYINKMTDDPLAPTKRGDEMRKDIGPSTGGTEEYTVQELFEIASAIRQTQANQADVLKDLQARAEDQVVVIKGERFPSLTFVSAYVKTHHIAPHALKFMDAMSILEMVTAMAQSFADNVDTQYRGSWSHMDRPSNQKAIYSFQLSAPTALAGPPDTARTHPRSLSAFKNYDAFKGTGSGDLGVVNELFQMLDEKPQRWRQR